MNEELAKFAVQQIGDRVGIAISCRTSRNGDGPVLDCIPLDGHPNESFTIRLNLKWRSAEAVLQLGRFSAPLIREMGAVSPEGRQLFASFARALQSKRIILQMRINGTDANPCEPAGWPAEWNRLELSFRTLPLAFEDESIILERLILDLLVPFFAMMAALIGVEENEPVTAGQTEGDVETRLATRYERKKINREACIQLKGCRCIVCGFDFGETYGPVGAGYIEVHHLKPVSTVGPGYQLNVERDLVPLCANCHAMAHREDPPIEPDRLKSLIQVRSIISEPVN